jgi:UDP-N-acetylmuramoylalanine--D-glutamate ligase
MIPVPHIYGQCFYVLGLGKSGISAAVALKHSGAKITAWDDKAENRAKGVDLGITLESPDSVNWKEKTALVLSPGIPHTFPEPHPVAKAAKDHHIPILCDVEFLFRAQKISQMIGITGTNGKSTTTALIAHILKTAHLKVQEGGNLGIPALDLTPLDGQGIYVIELSSYQLERMETPALEAAIFLNLSKNHLERHGGMDGYAVAKKKIFHLLKPQGFKIIGVDSPVMQEIYREIKSPHTIPISGFQEVEGIYCYKGVLMDRTRKIMDVSDIPTLRGSHNHQNIAAAYAAVTSLTDLDTNIICEGIRTYPGLAHRQELAGRVGNTLFINDSKATTLEASLKSISQYENIFWIVGGQAKEGWEDISSLLPYLPRIQKVFLIGEAADGYEKVLSPHLSCVQSSTLANAVKLAAEEAQKFSRNSVVLLAPACASWDQFTSFEQRGDIFKTLVKKLSSEVS